MKQLCYLTAAKNMHRLDDLGNELDISVISFAVDKVKSITTFLEQQIQHLQHFIIIDLTTTEVKYSHEHILKAVQKVRSFSTAELIFIAPDNDDTALLYGKLASFRVNRLIKLRENTDYIAEVRRMLTAKEEDFAFQTRMEAVQESMAVNAKNIVSPVTIPPGLVLTVSIAGTMQRIGTKTQTFALWHYLTMLGFKAAVQIADAKMMRILMELYKQDIQETNGYTLIRGIPFCSNFDSGFNAYIANLGVLSVRNVAQFSSADLSVLVTGVKPWEFAELGKAITHLKDCKPSRWATLVSFTGGQDLDALSGVLDGTVAAAPYHPDIWAAGTTAAYQTAILPHIKDCCGE